MLGKGSTNGGSNLGLLIQSPPVSFMALPRPVRFACSGALGNLVFFILYKICLNRISMTFHKATVAWVVSYMLSIPLQHFFNLVLVFGKTDDYFASLIISYAAYSVSVVVSSVLNGLLVHAGASHEVAWSACLVGTGFLNYYTVGGGKAPGVTGGKLDKEPPTMRSPSIEDAESGMGMVMTSPTFPAKPFMPPPATPPNASMTHHLMGQQGGATPPPPPPPAHMAIGRPSAVPRPKGKAD